jgi:hypothetical protein
MSLQIMGETVTADNLESIIRRCADNMPGDGKPDSHSWGASAASELFKGIKGTPLEQQGQTILAELFRSGSDDEVRLADTFTNPALMPPEPIRAALARTDLDADAQNTVRGALGRVLAAQPAKYDTALRAQMSHPGAESLLGAVMVADHAWFLSNIPKLLGTNPTAAGNKIWYGVVDLNADEARTLRSEIDALRSTLGDPLTTALLETIDGEIASGTFANRPQPKRW